MRVPATSKVEKACSKDRARPVLCDPALVIREHRVDGENVREGFLCATDSYKLVVIPVELDEADTAGSVPLEAVKAAAKDCAGQVIANGSAALPDGRSYPRDNGQHPDFFALIPDDSANAPKRCEVGVNVKFLAEAAAAMGTDIVRLSFLMDGDEINGLRPILVTPTNGVGVKRNASPVAGAKAVVMPVRIQGR